MPLPLPLELLSPPSQVASVLPLECRWRAVLGGGPTGLPAGVPLPPPAEAATMVSPCLFSGCRTLLKVSISCWDPGWQLPPPPLPGMHTGSQGRPHSRTGCCGGRAFSLGEGA